ncbi:hypothetical protein BO71DRAFT_417682 [Aspergillus ellipticus CBS 707.79]|uniref:AB hydrolase-1 domain-containing protein n=1 Tax=Aspergillus ellipticus CBS 707.79 TaxID=1448320 RepID=A0A319DRF6_9EURO|nr:hypothetical protein BO71DRAFT_417682 [Aspergillus ellipticus CBS 707.79]
MAASTVVLVPGAWHQPACMNQLRDELRSLGLDSVTLADAGHLVTVVAHSYGGLVAPRQSRGGGLIMLVYLAAFAIPAGQTLSEAVGGAPPPWATRSNPAEIFYHDLPRDVQDYWIARLLPTTRAVIEIPNTYEPWKHLPCTYILAEQDRALPLEAQKAAVAAMGEITTASVDASHSLLLSVPGEVAIPV